MASKQTTISRANAKVRAGRRAGGSSRRGGSLVEMAFVMSILVYLGFGMGEYGLYFFIKNALAGAAREGCRAAVVSTATNTNVTNAISTSLTAAKVTNYTTTISPSNVSGLTSGTSITVTVTATWSNVGVHMLPAGGIPSYKQIQGTAVMRRE